MKRVLIWFLKQWQIPEPDEDAWENSWLFKGFLEPIEDTGEMYEKWFNNFKQRSVRQQEFLNKTICPHTGKSCSKASCSAYREGGSTKNEREVSFTERLIARLENRPVKQAYTARWWLASCTKGVFNE